MDNNSNNRRPNRMPPPPQQRRQMPPSGDMRQRQQPRPPQRPQQNNGMNTGMYDRHVYEQRMQRTSGPERRPEIQRPSNTVPPRREKKKPSVALVWIAVLFAVLALIFLISLISGKFGMLFEKKDNAEITTDAAVNAGAKIEETEVPEDTPQYPVTYAKYTDDTVDFPYDEEKLDFANGILIDLESNTVIASRGGDDMIYPASMTKVMTLIVAVENAKSLDDTVTMTSEMLNPLHNAEASVAGFAPGEEVTVRDLIYGLILPSGGDGAVGLSLYIAGSEEAFAVMMNEKAAELGLTGTHFTNSTGLHDPNHYSTCHDIALIVEYAIKDEFMKEVLCTYKYTTAPTEQHPDGIPLASTMLSRMDGDESGTMFVQGGKTGYTIEGKNCLVSFATELIEGASEEELKKNDTKYVLVTTKSNDKFKPVHAAIAIYKMFYENSVPALDGTDSEKPVEKPVTEDEGVKIYTAAPPKP